MKRILFVSMPLALLLMAQLLYGQAPPLSWQKCYGGSDWDRALDGVQTADGGYIIAGDVASSDGNVTGYHGGYSDAWVVKLNSSGNLEWQKAMGGSAEESFRSVQQTSDGGFILVGETRSFDGDVSGNHGGEDDIWMVKLDAAGNMEWQKCLGGGYTDIGFCVQQTTDGGYIIAGVTSSFDGDVTFNYSVFGAKDAWVVKTNSTGTIEWQKCYGTSGNDQCNFISLTSDGGYIVAASASSWADGILSCTPHGSDDSWIIKISATGNIQWQQCLGGPGSETANCVRENADGSFIVLSSTNSNGGDVSGWHAPASGFPPDYWVVKLTSSGSIIWQKCLGGTSYDYPMYSVMQTSDGGFVACGFSTSNDGDVSGNHGGEDFWIVKLGSSGNIEWQHCYGGTSQDDCLSVKQTSDGGYILVGSSMSNDGDVSGNHGSRDVWVVKLAGSILPVELASFSAEKNNDQVNLKWETATEQNSDHFIIERSHDGRLFESIGSKPAAGNSQIPVNYYFTDMHPQENNYYRLKQVDMDGKYHYSWIVPVKFTKKESFTVYPNPSSGKINIQVISDQQQNVVFELVNGVGQVMLRRQKDLVKGNNRFEWDISSLLPGLYIIRSENRELPVTRIIRQ